MLENWKKDFVYSEHKGAAMFAAPFKGHKVKFFQLTYGGIFFIPHPKAGIDTASTWYRREY